MTTAPTIEELTEQGQGGEPRSWFDIAVGFAGEMVHPAFRRGDLAELRRMKPEEPGAAIFWRLLAGQGLLEGQEMSRELESKWGLILHGIALMTPTVEADSDSAKPRSSAHDPTVPVGLALFQGGDGSRTMAFYSESRLNRLLTARGPMLHTLLARTFRMLGTDQGLQLAADGAAYSPRGLSRGQRGTSAASNRPCLLPSGTARHSGCPSR